MSGLRRIRIEIEGPRDPLEVTVDPAASAAYIRVRFNAVARTIEHAQGVYLDVDAEGLLVGIELLLPASAQGIEDASEYYLAHERDADAELPKALSAASRLLAAVPA